LIPPRFKALNRPVYILIGQKKDAVARISIRPLTLFLITLAIIVATGMTEKNIFVANNQLEQQQTTNLQQEHLRIRAKLSETEALLALRNAEIESMQQQLQQNRQNMKDMRQRLDLFDQVLAKRKTAGVHFLRPSAIWKNEHAIAYQLILVKGKNYPRWIIGHLAFTVSDAEGRSISLPVAKKKNSGGKIEMTTQTFIEGELNWPKTWRPKKLTITLINHKGLEKGNITIPITRPNPVQMEQAS